ncbi:hypothetical protein [Leptospira sarikeiensis]|uniref:Lipoprotein n=1 Tax=Leptospira sarikeiensis TaxID=2484943 RepID=A0A4R9K1F0_9LEPT|nr:hypothetical protein [Leptospira sarikeiensis]TGL59513.1 hypothetical protein EHQ64_15580 [Leptospira sarikeiensis]
MIKKSYLLLAHLCAILFLFNCVFFDTKIDPIYTRPYMDRKLTKKIAVQINGLKDNTKFVSQGVKKISLGGVTANVYTKKPPTLILKEIIVSELTNAGLSIEDKYENDRTPKIEIFLNVFFTEPEMGLFAISYFGVIDTDVIVTIPGEGIYKKNIKSVGEQYSLIVELFSEGGFELAMQDYSKKFVYSVVELLGESRYYNEAK